MMLNLVCLMIFAFKNKRTYWYRINKCKAHKNAQCIFRILDLSFYKILLQYK